MNRIFQIIILIFISSSCNETHLPNDLKLLCLNGKINQIEEFSLMVDSCFNFNQKIDLDSLIQNSSINSRLVFNSSGNIIEETIFGNKQQTKNYIYLKDKLKIKCFVKSGLDAIITEHDYSYNKLDTLQKEIIRNEQGDTLRKITYTYNSLNLLQEKRFELEDERLYKFSYEYKDNLLVAENWYDFEGSIDTRIEYLHDTNNNIIEKIFLNPDKSMMSKLTYSYDSLNNKVLENWLKPDGVIEKTIKSEYIYDNNKNWILRLDKMNELLIIRIRRIAYL